MSPLLFVDLDDTLFHSHRKSAGAAGEPVAFDRDGEAASFMTARQRALFEWLVRDAEIVVTTGRSAEAYRRVDLRFAGYAICSHGGLILLPDGQPEPRWRKRITTEAAGHQLAFVSLLGAVRFRTTKAGVDARIRAISEGDLELYISIKHNQEDASELARLAEILTEEMPAGWRLCLNDNNLAVLPPFLGKELAVDWFLQEMARPDTFVVGFGDSLSDVPFMALCDYALTPSCSQLFSSLLARIS
jgi:hydroxymethylpyrimidine pyrophosphatase-like HAD family hydrolase